MNQMTVGAGGTAAGAAPEAEGPHQRRLRNYLLDSRLQLRFASYLVVVAAAIAAGLGWLLWNAYSESSRLVALGDPRVDDALAAALAHEDRQRMVWLAVALVVVVLCLAIFAVVITHRVAGPALFLARVCRGVGEGKLARPRPLRRHDLLVDLADEVSVMIEMLREKESQEGEALRAAVGTLRRPGATPAEQEVAEVLERLAGEKSRRILP